MGQLIVGISGCALTMQEKRLLTHPLIAGVILFSRNFETKAQLAELNAEIHACRSVLPLEVYVDQEGGRVQRFREGFTSLPALGDLTSPEHAFEAGKTMASELKAVGVDYSFAPVVDLDRGSEVIGKRAFSSDPQAVIRLAQAYIKGMAAVAMAPIIKHFPGHGTVKNDTHIAVAMDARPLVEIEQVDLWPFEYFIDSGVFGVMVSHVIYSAVDPLPASISAFWLQTILRDRFHFRGKIFSDDLGMRAISYLGSPVDLVRRVFAAGVDYALLCNDWSQVQDVIQNLEES